MEKQDVPAAKKRRRNSRLLILFLFAAVLFPSYAEKLNRGQIRSLQVLPLSDAAFTQQECVFVLTIPGVPPEQVQTAMPVLPEHVQFVSSRRSDFIDSDRDRGTRLEFWFSFKASGNFTIPALTAVINGRRYSIPFAKISVQENPDTALPKMIVRFSRTAKGDKDKVSSGGDFLGNDKSVAADADAANVGAVSSRNREFLSLSDDVKTQPLSCVVGESVYFTVYLKYVLQIVKFDWELQKDALFTEIKRYEIAEGKPRGREFFAEEVPVADFEWRPLLPGEWSLPNIKITATAYNGSRVEVYTPFSMITVLEPDEAPFEKDSASISVKTPYGPPSDTDKANSLFAYAFEDSGIQEKEAHMTSLQEEECRRLADLRCEERKSLPFSASCKARIAYEKRFGIPTGVTEPSVPLFYWCSALCVLFGLLTLTAVFFKKRIFVLFLILFAAMFVMLVVNRIKLNQRYAVFAGGSLSPVPEHTAVVSHEETGGLRVKVLERVGNWTYISYNGNGGWVLSDRLFLIE
ncbi:hypothetical protein [Treponema parvum]|uniref:hypothetical protein n=1 Tax=Treponema parvum TaxID=138851 RepID=UPI001AEC1CA6|nr:hypothetical protein [Treponema parvum]QTQ16994.1 hypothetical protein HXT04_09975 [Treponema parvum]